MDKLLFEMLGLKLKQNPEVKQQLPDLHNKVINGEITPFIAAKTLIDFL